MARAGDARPQPSFSYYPLHTLPAVHGLVWCLFPEGAGLKPGPKPRPALVRSVRVNKAGDKAAVEVTFGTSKIKEFERPLDLIIANCTEMNAAGLPQVTRFDLDRTLVLPWSREFFVPREGKKDPHIGSLLPTATAQLQALIVERRRLGVQVRQIAASQAKPVKRR
jgi:hypothetical protein